MLHLFFTLPLNIFIQVQGKRYTNKKLNYTTFGIYTHTPFLQECLNFLEQQIQK